MTAARPDADPDGAFDARSVSDAFGAIGRDQPEDAALFGDNRASSMDGGVPSREDAFTSTAADASATAAISSTLSTRDVGLIEVNVATPLATWTITNTGGTTIAALTLTSSSPSEIYLANGCANALLAGASCAISVSFSASVAGPRSATLTATASAGVSTSATLKAAAGYRVTVVRTGIGTVTSNPLGIDCGDSCSAVFAPGPVILGANTYGTGALFSGWSGGNCFGSAPCTLKVASPITVNAAFANAASNLIFVTSEAFPATLGSATAYDAKCNAAATRVGVNDPAGTSFVAFVSDRTSLAAERLGSARGWVRMDGRPFADTLATLFANNRVFNPVLLDETGAPTVVLTITGTSSDGTLVPSGTCSDWTSSAGTAVGGFSDGGPVIWTHTPEAVPCARPSNILCMGKSKTSTVSPIVNGGRNIWVSKAAYLVGGSLTPDDVCQAERSVGIATAAALIAHPERPASSVLVPTMSYVRPDGTSVGTGAQITAGTLESGIWQTIDGSYADLTSTSAWTGSSLPDVVSTPALSCDGWVTATGTATMGRVLRASGKVWWDGLSGECRFGGKLYCVQTSP